MRKNHGILLGDRMEMKQGVFFAINGNPCEWNVKKIHFDMNFCTFVQKISAWQNLVKICSLFAGLRLINFCHNFLYQLLSNFVWLCFEVKVPNYPVVIWARRSTSVFFCVFLFVSVFVFRALAHSQGKWPFYFIPRLELQRWVAQTQSQTQARVWPPCQG